MTAVEWYSKQHLSLLLDLENKEISLGEYVVKHQELFEQAKQMEKQQLGKFYNHRQWTTVHGDTFKEHYNKTFKSE